MDVDAGDLPMKPNFTALSAQEQIQNKIEFRRVSLIGCQHNLWQAAAVAAAQAAAAAPPSSAASAAMPASAARRAALQQVAVT
jgi:hypothetical protein